MDVQTFKGGYDDNFTYVLLNGDECIIIDPAVPAEQILTYLNEKKLNPLFVVVMHSHHDHIVDLKKYQEKGILIYAHEAIEAEKFPVDFAKLLHDNEKLHVWEKDDITMTVLHTPGHRFDCMCLYVGDYKKEERSVFTSDTLFVEGCGRVDFPGSDKEVMPKTLQRLKDLPDDTIVYPGHDYGSAPTSTIGKEKKNNPFLNMDADRFKERFA